MSNDVVNYIAENRQRSDIPRSQREKFLKMHMLDTGYYGRGGYQQIMHVACMITRIMGPQDDYVAIPFIMTNLIQGDLNVTSEKATEICHNATSIAFGDLLHPHDNLTDVEEEAVSLFCAIWGSATGGRVPRTLKNDIEINKEFESDSDNDDDDNNVNTDDIDGNEDTEDSDSRHDTEEREDGDDNEDMDD